MVHTYKISGMTCIGCQAKVQSLLSHIKGVKNVAIDLSTSEAVINMDTHMDTSIFKAALKEFPKYQLEEKQLAHQMDKPSAEEDTRTWLQIYKPLLLICAYILGVTLLVEITSTGFILGRWLQHFMAAFFLVFSFFKLLDIEAFADSYFTYDIVAKKWRAWGYIYAFIELGLGIAFLLNFKPMITNIITFTVMSISIIGVLQSVLNKRKIKCACLGAVFNLPMSTVTVIEDGLMIAMSMAMIITMYN